MSVSLVGLLALGHCAAFADRHLPAVAAPLLKTSLGLSDTQLGFLDGPAFVLLYVAGMLVSWPLANSPHRLRLLAGCIGVWVLGMLIFALAPTFDVLVVGRALVGFGQALFVPLALGLIVQCSAPGQRGRSMAVFTAAAVAGRGLALLAGGAALMLLAHWMPASAHAHWRVLFLVMAAPNVLLMVLLCCRRERIPTSPSSSKVAAEMLAAFRARPGTFCAYLGSAGASVLVVQGIGAWAPSILHREQGLSPAVAALVFGLALLVASPLGHLLAGLLVDKRARHVTPMSIVAVALMAVVPMLWAIPSATSATQACVLLALASLAGGTAAVAALAGLPLMLHVQVRDIGLRLFLTFITLVGVALGPYMAGVVSDSLGMGGHGLSLALYKVCSVAAAAGVSAALLASQGWHRVVAEVAE
ncbi:MFS transporter [Dyella sp.]|uniref:MFS transporter n=1 Tax=Dyella sp. TaxID=1869338 RepID=UPI002852104F|nr:MFS transporter [Dyella sp.]MDR3447433.1 MFS transporter [Dyella sp.]